MNGHIAVGHIAVGLIAVGLFAVRHFAVGTLRRQGISPLGHFTVWTLRRTANSPSGHFAVWVFRRPYALGHFAVPLFFYIFSLFLRIRYPKNRSYRLILKKYHAVHS